MPTTNQTFTFSQPVVGKDDEYDSIIKGMDDNIFKKMKRAYGIYEPGDMKDWDNFYIFNRMDPFFQIGTTKEYVFFVKPDLHIFNLDKSTFFEPISRNPFFVDLRYRGGNSGRYMKVLKNLQKSAADNDDNCPFIRAFTNKIRSSVDLPDIQASDQETASNQFGTKITYRKSSISSDEGFDFTTEFEDNKFLEIYTWFKAYDEYERMKYKGYIKIDENAAPFESNGATGKIVVAGSSSVTPVMEKLVEAYGKANANVEIEVQESDSSTGMQSTIDGLCDIGMASRELKDSELEQGLTPTVIALDGIAVVVNNDNPTDDMTSDQVKSIFTGDVLTWEDALN